MKSPPAVSIEIATADSIAGAQIAATLGVVVGISIRHRGVSGNIMAGLEAIGNGSALDEYRDELVAVRREALERMQSDALSLGADAVVGVRFDSAEVGREMIEVVAYGTAVVLRQRHIRRKSGSHTPEKTRRTDDERPPRVSIETGSATTRLPKSRSDAQTSVRWSASPKCKPASGRRAYRPVGPAWQPGKEPVM